MTESLVSGGGCGVDLFRSRGVFWIFGFWDSTASGLVLRQSVCAQG